MDPSTPRVRIFSQNKVGNLVTYTTELTYRNRNLLYLHGQGNRSYLDVVTCNGQAAEQEHFQIQNV